MLLSQVSTSHSIHMVGHAAVGNLKHLLMLLLFLHCREGSFLPGFAPSVEMVNSESVVGIKSGDCNKEIGDQVDEFTCTWLVEHFVAQSHSYSGFTGKASTPTHLQLESGCDGYSFFWTKQLQTLNMVLIPFLISSIETLERDASFDVPDVMTSSVSVGLQCSVNIISDNYMLLLASSMKSHKLCCKTRVFLLPVPHMGNMSASKLIHFIPSHPVASGFRASLPLDNITVNTVNKKIAFFF